MEKAAYKKKACVSSAAVWLARLRLWDDEGGSVTAAQRRFDVGDTFVNAAFQVTRSFPSERAPLAGRRLAHVSAAVN